MWIWWRAASTPAGAASASSSASSSACRALCPRYFTLGVPRESNRLLRSGALRALSLLHRRPRSTRRSVTHVLFVTCGPSASVLGVTYLSAFRGLCGDLSESVGSTLGICLGLGRATRSGDLSVLRDTLSTTRAILGRTSCSLLGGLGTCDLILFCFLGGRPFTRRVLGCRSYLAKSVRLIACGAG